MTEWIAALLSGVLSLVGAYFGNVRWLDAALPAFDDSPAAEIDVADSADGEPGRALDYRWHSGGGGDWGTGSGEFSAVALNEDLNRLLVGDDEDRLFEFDLNPDGSVVDTPRRMVRVNVGGGDLEGLRWIEGRTYALASENSGLVSVVELADDAPVIDSDSVRATVATGIAELDGNGVEGVGLDLASGGAGSLDLFVVDEAPPSVHKIDASGTRLWSTPVNLMVADASDVVATSDGRIAILSDDSATLVFADVDADGVITERRRIDLYFDAGLFTQAEGVAISRDQSRIYVVGEAGGAGSLTLALLVADR